MKNVLYVVVITYILTACSQPLEVVGVRPQEAPGQPVVSCEDNNITITWESVKYAEFYHVYYSANPTMPDAYHKTSDTQYTINGLDNDTNYYIWVKSGNRRGTSSQFVTFTVLAPPVLRVSDITGSGFKLEWDAVSGATGYNLYQSTGSAYTKRNTDYIITGTELVVTGLSYSTGYYFKISSISEDTEGLLSDALGVSTLFQAPANVRATTTTHTSIKLEWNGVIAASGYNVYKSTNESGPFEKKNNAMLGSPSFTDTELSPNTTYYYKVAAISTFTSAEGMLSNVIPVTTLLPAPANLRVSAKTDTNISLEWDPVDEANGYRITRTNIVSGNTTVTATMTTNNTTYTDTTATPFTSYNYRVAAISQNNVNGMQSNQVSATIDIVPGSNLIAKLDWVKSNWKTNGVYNITINADEYIVPQILSASYYSITIILSSGDDTEHTVNLNAGGAIFTVYSGVTFILENNITLKGRSGNNDALVRINSGGTLILREGSKITGNHNTSTTGGGGVYVYGGIFTMDGGQIYGNSASDGGGVNIVPSGIFTMSNGKIYDNTATDSGGGVNVNAENGTGNNGGIFSMRGGEIYGNNATNGGGVMVLQRTGGTTTGNRNGRCYMSGGVIYGTNAEAQFRNTADTGAVLDRQTNSITQYGSYNNDTFYKSDDLTSTDTTVRVVNGNLERE